MATATALDVIVQMRKLIGTTEHPPGSNHNDITVWYNNNVAKIGDGPWCDMAVSKAGSDAKAPEIVGLFAWTVAHANWFASRGEWHSGTDGIAPGDPIFFDFGGSRNRQAIDHVGVVERVSGGVITTIEGNTGPGPGQCRRVDRDSKYVAGYGRPRYVLPKLAAPRGNKLLEVGSVGAAVGMLQRCLNKLGARLVVDGDFGDLTKKALVAFQKKVKIKPDGQYGTQSAKAMAKALG